MSTPDSQVSGESSSQVLRKLLMQIENKDMTELLSLCDNASTEFEDDYHIQQVCTEIRVYAEFRNDSGLEEVKSRIKDILLLK